MRGTESNIFQAASANTAAFTLMGGVYSVAVIATWNSTGTVTLQQLGPDGTTWMTALTAISADGIAAPVALPPGQYRLAIATATGVYATIARIPGE